MLPSALLQRNHPSSGPRRNIVNIALITAVCLIGDSMLYVVLPVRWEDAGLSALWEVGVLLSVNRFIRLPLSPVIGWLYGKISIRQGMLIAVALSAVVTVGYGFAQGFYIWLILRCLWGIAWTLLRIGALLAIVELSDAGNRGYFLGTYNGLFRLGSLVGMLVGGLLADLSGLLYPSLFFGIAVLVCIPMMAAGFGDSPRSPEHALPRMKPDFRALRNRPGLLWLLASGTAVSLVFDGVLNSTLSHAAERLPGFPISIFGIMLGAATVAGMLQALRWGWGPWLSPFVGKLTDSFGFRPILVVILTAAGLCFIGATLAADPAWWMLAVLGCLAASTVLTTTLDTAVTNTAAGDAKTAVISLHTLSGDFGAALGPLLAFLVIDTYGVTWLYAGVAAALLLLSARWAYAWMFRHSEVKADGGRSG